MKQTEFEFTQLFSCPGCGMPTSDREGTICGRFPECHRRPRPTRPRPERTRRHPSGGLVDALVTSIGFAALFGSLYFAVSAIDWVFGKK